MNMTYLNKVDNNCLFSFVNNIDHIKELNLQYQNVSHRQSDKIDILNIDHTSNW